MKRDEEDHKFTEEKGAEEDVSAVPRPDKEEVEFVDKSKKSNIIYPE